MLLVTPRKTKSASFLRAIGRAVSLRIEEGHAVRERTSQERGREDASEWS
jgi:hypothetical protein